MVDGLEFRALGFRVESLEFGVESFGVLEVRVKVKAAPNNLFYYYGTKLRLFSDTTKYL